MIQKKKSAELLNRARPTHSIEGAPVAGEILTTAHTDYLVKRLGHSHARQRIATEAGLESRENEKGLYRKITFWNIVKLTLPILLRVTGLIARGRANAAKFAVVKNDIQISCLPTSFEGFRILHLSDLHSDISKDAMKKLPKAIAGLEYDICVITGDFRGKIFGQWREAATITHEAISGVRTPIYGILGNHDSSLMVECLEDAGIKMLMNEAISIERAGDKIWLAGIDDPHFYRTNDLSKAISRVPPASTIILLSHSTDGYEEAANAQVAAMLCGHTHGGQICLPGSRPVLTSSKKPRKFASGSWSHGAMEGYTSRGVGTSCLPIRFNCPPEITIHTLRAKV